MHVSVDHEHYEDYIYYGQNEEPGHEIEYGSALFSICNNTVLCIFKDESEIISVQLRVVEELLVHR